MKKVLAIAPYAYLPFYSGGQKFIARFFEYLGREVDLTVISVPENDASLATTYKMIPLFKSSFSRYYDRSLIGKISRLIMQNGFDSIIWEHPYLAWLAFRVRKRTGIRTIIHTHNIEYQRFRSLGKWWWPILRNYEKKAFRKADEVLFITPEDKDFAIRQWKIDPGKCLDLPFGIEIRQYPPDRSACRDIIGARHGIGGGERIFFFNGLLDYKPNLDALKAILERINPILLQKAKFPYRIIVCGKGLPDSLNSLKDYRDKHVVFAGFTPDIDQYAKASDVLLNPVQAGGGIKTKMVEAIGYGTRVVSTQSGAAGMKKEICGEMLVVVGDNDWEAFASALLEPASSLTMTPTVYYDYYYWGNIIRNLLSGLAQHASRRAQDK